MAKHYDFGKQAEQKAKQFLEYKNYQILETNWYFGKFEIDIIAQKKETLVIVEVKALSSTYFKNPSDAVDFHKRQRLVKAANAYVEKKDLDLEVRFDIISILKTAEKFKVQHLENAFESFE